MSNASNHSGNPQFPAGGAAPNPPEARQRAGGQDATISVYLSADQAWALAQFVKRVGWHEMRGNAFDDDEAYLIREAIDRVREALADEGIAPR